MDRHKRGSLRALGRIWQNEPNRATDRDFGSALSPATRSRWHGLFGITVLRKRGLLAPLFADLAIPQVLVGGLHSPTQRKVVIFQNQCTGDHRTKEMSRISFMLLIVTGLALTVYFGTAAWRVTDASHLDITGRIPPVVK